MAFADAQQPVLTRTLAPPAPYAALRADATSSVDPTATAIAVTGSTADTQDSVIAMSAPPARAGANAVTEHGEDDTGAAAPTTPRAPALPVAHPSECDVAFHERSMGRASGTSSLQTKERLHALATDAHRDAVLASANRPLDVMRPGVLGWHAAAQITPVSEQPDIEQIIGTMKSVDDLLPSVILHLAFTSECHKLLCSLLRIFETFRKEKLQLALQAFRGARHVTASWCVHPRCATALDIGQPIAAHLRKEHGGVLPPLPNIQSNSGCSWTASMYAVCGIALYLPQERVPHMLRAFLAAGRTDMLDRIYAAYEAPAIKGPTTCINVLTSILLKSFHHAALRTHTFAAKCPKCPYKAQWTEEAGTPTFLEEVTSATPERSTGEAQKTALPIFIQRSINIPSAWVPDPCLNQVHKDEDDSATEACGATTRVQVTLALNEIVCFHLRLQQLPPNNELFFERSTPGEYTVLRIRAVTLEKQLNDQSFHATAAICHGQSNQWSFFDTLGGAESTSGPIEDPTMIRNVLCEVTTTTTTRAAHKGKCIKMRPNAIFTPIENACNGPVPATPPPSAAAWNCHSLKSDDTCASVRALTERHDVVFLSETWVGEHDTAATTLKRLVSPSACHFKSRAESLADVPPPDEPAPVFVARGGVAAIAGPTPHHRVEILPASTAHPLPPYVEAIAADVGPLRVAGAYVTNTKSDVDFGAFLDCMSAQGVHVVMGDLNADHRREKEPGVLRDEYGRIAAIRARPEWIILGPSAATFHKANTTPDIVIARVGVIGLSVSVLRDTTFQNTSDHLPVAMLAAPDLETACALRSAITHARGPKTHFALHKATGVHWDKYRKTVADQIARLARRENATIATRAVAIQRIIIASAKRHLPCGVVRKGHSPLWSNELSILHAQHAQGACSLDDMTAAVRKRVRSVLTHSGPSTAA